MKMRKPRTGAAIQGSVVEFIQGWMLNFTFLSNSQDLVLLAAILAGVVLI